MNLQFFHFKLPILFSLKRKWLLGISFGLSALFLYGISKPHSLYEIHRFELTTIDQNIPFLPWTIWIYVSGLIYMPIAYHFNRSVVSINKHAYTFSSLVILSSTIFWFYPTVYPRELFPVPDSTNEPTYLLLTWIRQIDSPTNCTPSLHVSIAYLLALGFREISKKYFPWIFLWASLIALSTLTVKQHYVVDVLAGIAVAILLHFLFRIRKVHLSKPP
jgi:membrane-associated phospholipid phosphatase